VVASWSIVGADVVGLKQILSANIQRRVDINVAELEVAAKYRWPGIRDIEWIRVDASEGVDI
jgi:hypothetical protein